MTEREATQRKRHAIRDSINLAWRTDPAYQALTCLYCGMVLSRGQYVLRANVHTGDVIMICLGDPCWDAAEWYVKRRTFNG